MSLISKLRKRGVIHTAETVFNRIVPAWIFRYSEGVVYELNLGQLANATKESAPDAWDFWSVKDAEDRETLRRVTWNSVPRQFSDKDLGYAIGRPGDEPEIVGGVWVGVKDFAESDLGFEIDFTERQAWLYCAYLTQPARGGGVYQKLLSFIARDLQKLGYDQLLVIVQPWNKASTYVHKKYSKRILGRVRVLRLLTRSCVFASGEIRKDKTWAKPQSGDRVVLIMDKPANPV